MKKLLCFLVGVSFLVSCGGKQPKVDKAIEDGVEVVLNHNEPYRIKGEPSSFRLEEELRIDFENPKFADLGLEKPEGVDTDSEGNIYVYERIEPLKHFIFKFDREGNFIKSFGQMGQGPGEMQILSYFRISSRDELLITDSSKKTLVFDKEGSFIKETKYNPRWTSVLPLENGNYLATGGTFEETPAGKGRRLTLYDTNFNEVKTLDFFDMSGYTPGKKRAFAQNLFTWSVKNGKIYVGNEKRGYEIWAYDYDGKLLRKIRKEYAPVKYPNEFKTLVEEMAKKRTDIYPLEYCPPYNSFFIDDNGRLFVMAYEQRENKEEYVHDVFSSEGIFIGRAMLGLTGSMGQFLNTLHATAKNGRYYRLRYKEEGGYQELIVYKIVLN
jgi:hypothetical protein